MKKIIIIVSSILCVIALAFITIFFVSTSNSKEQTTLTFIGHSSIKLKSKDGKVIYIDPYFESDTLYNESADFILITHEHNDHNRIDLCKQNKDCKIFHYYDVLQNEEYKSFDFGNIKIQGVPAGGNIEHPISINVGYIVTIDGIRVYHSGGTSIHNKMELITNQNIDYALYTINELYTMDYEQATKMANMVGAKHNIPIHGTERYFYDQREKFHPKNKLLLDFGQTIVLK